MDIRELDFILNDALNKALISKDRIKQPNSNNVADFVSKYIAENNHDLQLQQTGVKQSVCYCKNTAKELIATLWLFLGIANFLIFAYDIQNDRDYWTWVWLLTSQVSFLGSLRFWIKHDRE